MRMCDTLQKMDPIRTPAQIAPSVPDVSSRRFSPLIVLALIIIVLGSVWYFWFVREKNRTEIAPGETLVTAPTGKVIRGFPDFLLIEPDMTVESSYRIDYENVSQPTVAYVSAKTIHDNVVAFRNYLEANGWDIVYAADEYQLPITFFYATRGMESVNITLETRKDSPVNVSIAYARAK